MLFFICDFYLGKTDHRIHKTEDEHINDADRETDNDVEDPTDDRGQTASLCLFRRFLVFQRPVDDAEERNEEGKDTKADIDLIFLHRFCGSCIFWRDRTTAMYANNREITDLSTAFCTEHIVPPIKMKSYHP